VRCHDCGEPVDESNHVVFDGHLYCIECYDGMEDDNDEEFDEGDDDNETEDDDDGEEED
jgi:hypothetical protein